jgi:hypothetical protein
MAGFQVSISGRFWVSTEGTEASSVQPSQALSRPCGSAALLLRWFPRLQR